MRYSSRFFLYAPIVLFLALAIGACSYWWVVASALSKRLDAWNGHTVIPGVTLLFESKTISGFPFNIDVVFRNFRIRIETSHGETTWSAQNFALHALTYGRNQVLFEAAGQQSFMWHDLKRSIHALPFQVGELHASSISNDHGLARLDVDCIGFGSPALTAARIQLHMRVNPNGQAIDVVAEGDAVHLSLPLVSLFGDTLNEIRAQASFEPARAFAALRRGETNWIEASEYFRTTGGTVDFSDVELSWPHVSGLGKGRLSLDADHNLSGHFDFQVTGIETVVETANHQKVRGAAYEGIARALLDRATKAPASPTGTMGAVVGFHGGLVSIGDDGATTLEPLY